MEEPGAISGPVMTQFGAHFIRFNARKAAEQQAFSSVKMDIIRSLRRKRGAGVRQDIINRYRAELAGVELDIDKAAIRERLGLPPVDSEEPVAGLPGGDGSAAQ
jgi:parvulin-like peptidyl-prolyl isomerase